MPKFELLKKLISGESIWGPLGGGGTSIVCQTICCLNIYQYNPKIITLACAIKKISFLGPHFGGLWGEASKKFRRQNYICSPTNLHKN